MFERLWPKKEIPQGATEGRPTFEELRTAMPENLRKEFKKLGDYISTLGTAKDGKEIEYDYLSPEEQAAVNRYDELKKIAIANIESSKETSA